MLLSEEFWLFGPKAKPAGLTGLAAEISRVFTRVPEVVTSTRVLTGLPTM